MNTNNSKNTSKQKMEINNRRLLGVLNLIPSEEFEKNLDKLDYLIKLIETDDKKLENIVIGVYSDNKDIVVITSAKTYIINIDYEDPITKEIKTRVHSQQTGWKRIDTFSKYNKREIILNRLIVSSGIYYEQVNNITITSKYEFMEKFKEITAIQQGELTKQIKAEGKSNEDGSEIELDITDDMNTLSIIKFVYNKLKNDSLKVILLGVRDDMTLINFETSNHILKFEIGLLKKTVTMIKK